MRKIKKIFAASTMAAMLMLPTYGAMASSVSFANFTFTTIPYAEKWERVTSKAKVDNEQNWYLTLTQKSELDSKEVRALAISNDVDPAMQGLNPYPLKSTTTLWARTASMTWTRTTAARCWATSSSAWSAHRSRRLSTAIRCRERSLS